MGIGTVNMVVTQATETESVRLQLFKQDESETFCMNVKDNGCEADFFFENPHEALAFAKRMVNRLEAYIE